MINDKYKLVNVDESNIKEFLKVHYQSWKESYVGIVEQEYLDNIDKNFENDVINLIERLKEEKEKNIEKFRFLLYVDDKPLGFVSYGKSRIEGYLSDGELHAIYLLDEIKKKGYGRILFDFAVKKLKEMNYNRMLIGCLKNNPTNDFYKYMGGEEILEKVIYINGKEYKEIFFVVNI